MLPQQQQQQQQQPPVIAVDVVDERTALLRQQNNNNSPRRAELPPEACFEGHPTAWAVSYFISILPILTSIAFYVYSNAPTNEHNGEKDFSYAAFEADKIRFFLMLGGFFHGWMKNPQDGLILRCFMENWCYSVMKWPDRPTGTPVTMRKRFETEAKFLTAEEKAKLVSNFDHFVWYVRHVFPSLMVLGNAVGQSILTGLPTYLVLNLLFNSTDESSASQDEIMHWNEVDWNGAAIGIGLATLALASFKFITEVSVGGARTFAVADEFQQLPFRFGKNLIACDFSTTWEKKKNWFIEIMGRVVITPLGTLGFVYEATRDSRAVFGKDPDDWNVGPWFGLFLVWIVTGMIFGAAGMPATRIMDKVLAPALQKGKESPTDGALTRGEVCTWFCDLRDKNGGIWTVVVAILGAFATGCINSRSWEDFIEEQDGSFECAKTFFVMCWILGSVVNLFFQGRDFINAYSDKGLAKRAGEIGTVVTTSVKNTFCPVRESASASVSPSSSSINDTDVENGNSQDCCGWKFGFGQ